MCVGGVPLSLLVGLALKQAEGDGCSTGGPKTTPVPAKNSSGLSLGKWRVTASCRLAPGVSGCEVEAPRIPTVQLCTPSAPQLWQAGRQAGLGSREAL